MTGPTTRAARLRERARNPAWHRPPLRIDMAACVTCDLCVTRCPERYGAIVRRRFEVVIVPELCSGCGACLDPCPVDCIVGDPGWSSTPASLWADVRG